MTDENLAYIFNEYGNPHTLQSLSEQEVQSAQKTVNSIVSNYLKDYGRSTLRNGALIIIHPDDLFPIVNQIFRNDPQLGGNSIFPFCYTVFGESIFGIKHMVLGL